jgi:anti-sigma factor RsiW
MAEGGRAITCQEIVELLTNYIEDALPPETADVVEGHLHICPGCTHYLDQMRITIAAVGEVREEDLSPEAQQLLLEAFKDWRRSSS